MNKGMKYRHYKGGEYEFVCLAFRDVGVRATVYDLSLGTGMSSENEIESVVVYRALIDGTTWVRPAKEFFEIVRTAGGYDVPRFTPLLPKKE